MDNPFKPGAGSRPPLLAGREPLLRDFDVIRRRVEELGEGDRSWILNGLRGVGNTALLNEFLTQANDREWIAAKVELSAALPLPLALSQALVKALRTATGRYPEPMLRRLLGVFKAFCVRVDPIGAVTFGTEVNLVDGVADTVRFSQDLAALFEVMGETARDSVSGRSCSSMSCRRARQTISPQSIPLCIWLARRSAVAADARRAGLPSLPAQLADAPSYAERLYDYRPIGLLDQDASTAALTGPAAGWEVEWSADAIAEALAIAKGYPYFIQSVGKRVWDVAAKSPITVDDVRAGGEFARREVNDGLYVSRWDRATTAQQSLLRAMAELSPHDESVGMAELALHMGRRRQSDLSVARNQLIKKGLAYSPERGQLAFTVPGMAAFIAAQP